ncbi:uncharacterized protein LOC141696525 [Apium graveolens]|uniref:uncharacterized protein LOC141696525 n=1 Tax=Apium graveolens TaxID=4045 RepID=UPI003D7B3630
MIAVLVKEEHKLQKPVHYISKVLHGAELNYSTTEKFVLALITASKKLRPYFQAHKIKVLTDQPLRNILQSPKDSGRLIKLAIELEEFDIKSQGQEIITPEGGENDKNKETTQKEYWVLHFDGASKTKFSAVGLVLQSLDGFMIEYALKLDFPTTKNKEEFEALIVGLGFARAVRAKNMKVCGESRHVVAQVNGQFEAKDDTVAKYLRVIKGILTQFDEWYAEHVPREEKTMADALSQFASSEIENYPKSIYFQVLKTPTIIVINLIAPVFCYSLPECLRPLEAEEALKEAHERIYGQHLGGRALTHKITRLGFYWTTMLADATTYVKKCDRCQRLAQIVRKPPERLTSISTPIPFLMWGMDILGPFPVASGQRKFIMVDIDYFTKWIEAKALAKIATK